MQEEDWACDACFSKNPTSADFCQVCYYPQPRQSSPVNVPQESIPSIPVRQYTQDSVEGYHTPPRGGSPSTYGTPDQKREHDGEIYAPYSPEDHNKGDRKRDGELVSRHSMTPSSLPTTVVNRDRDRLSTRPVTFDLVEFVYAIGVKPFYQGQDSVAEKNARKLVDLLQMKLGQKYVQLVIAVSDEGSPGAFIKVGASFQDLEKLAEEQKLELKVKDEYAERTGQHYQAFTRKLKAANVFHHPCLYTSPKADFNYDCSRGNPGRPCTCDLFLPFHKEELVKHVIHECLDTFMGEKFEGFGLRTAVAKGVVQEVFPLHMDKRYRDDFAKNYVMWRSVLRTPWAFTDRSRRFIEYWRAYFGEKMGMYMGFLHYYITALLFLAIPGIVLTVFSYLEGADNFGVPMYCMYVGVWSIIWLQMWARKQSVWAYGWGMENFESEEKEIPDYIRRTADQRLAFGFYSGGDWIDLDAYARAKLQEEQAGHISADMSITQLIPKNKSRTDGSIRRTSKQIFTNSVLLTFSAGVVFATLGLLLFRLIVQRANDYWGGFAGGVLNGVSIFILEQVYMRIAMALNDWENHRTATEYEDSLVYKTFFFGFVNAYCSLFYIAFYKGHSSLFGYEDYCKDARGARSPDCMTELSTQLYSILLTRLFLGTVIEVSVPWITLRWNMYRSQRRITAMKARGGESLLPSRQRLKDAVQTEADMPSYSTAKVSGTFYDYYELAVQFGFVVLFAPAFPLAPFLALMSNIVEVATDGYKTLEEMKKPVYHGAADIGPWYNVFNFLCVIGVITNSLIIGFTSNQLDYWLEYPSASNKWLFVVFIEHVVLAFLYLIAMGIPNQPKWVREKVAKASKISDIETEYVSAVKVWRSEKDSHLNAAMLSKYQYDASEDEKETSAERSAPAPTGVSGGGGYSRGYGLGSWDEPGAPSGAPSYHYGAPTGSSNHGIIPGLDASQSTARSYLNYGGPSYGTQQFSQTEQRGY